jgi:hypothetical protein
MNVTLEDAKQALTNDDRTLDEAADAILLRVARFFGECVAEESFCALGVDEKRDANGKLLYLRLVPCDDIAGVPARRFPRD